MRICSLFFLLQKGNYFQLFCKKYCPADCGSQIREEGQFYAHFGVLDIANGFLLIFK